jgi:hypothetical protein
MMCKAMPFVRLPRRVHDHPITNRWRSPVLIAIQSFVRLFESLIFPTSRQTTNRDDDADFYDITSRYK